MSAAHDDLATIKIYILDPQRHALTQTESAAVHQLDAESNATVQVLEDRAELGLTQNRSPSGGAISSDRAVRPDVTAGRAAASPNLVPRRHNLVSVLTRRSAIYFHPSARNASSNAPRNFSTRGVCAL